ncbi:zinc ABC transporter substrate-binding protein [Virgibacillus proomii]|nr:zinc ABC transporter substrate-binding protein [Virgibacillus proomii]
MGCTKSTSQPKNNSDLTIYTSIYPLQFAVEQIGGETVKVNSIYPPGVDAHTYEPASKVVTDIAKSDAFIYMGAGLEGFAESMANALAKENVTLIEIGKHESLFAAANTNQNRQSHDESSHSHDDEHSHDEHDHSHHDHDHGDYDPHIWLDPLRMIEMSEIIKNQLVKLNPEHQALYNQNFKQLKKQLKKLDRDFQQVLHAKENKHILVSHAAYGYWEERYGLVQIAISGLSSSNEPSQKDLVNIIEQAKQYKLDYLIFEQNSSNRISEIIQEHIDAKAVTIHNLSTRTEKDIHNNEDYLSLMKQNLLILDKVTK